MKDGNTVQSAEDLATQVSEAKTLLKVAFEAAVTAKKEIKEASNHDLLAYELLDDLKDELASAVINGIDSFGWSSSSLQC